MKNEDDVFKQFPVILFHNRNKIRDFFTQKREVDFKPKEVKCRVNFGDPGCGKTCGAIVTTFEYKY